MKKSISLLIIMFAFIFTNLNANEMYQTVEPKDATLVKTDSSKEFCNVCGMHLTKYYKTNHVAEFRNGHKEQYCSLHCLAEIHKNHEEKIKQIQVVDTNSLKLIDATKAFYVVGSSKEGTMSSISEYAFLKKEEAEKLKAEIQNLTHRMDQMEKRASMYEEQFRETSKTVQSIDFNVNNLLKLFDKLESRMSNDQEILHKRIGSLKQDFEDYQMKDLKNYYNYKRVIVNTVLTLIIGGLFGGVVTAWRVFKING